ncbi:MAG TPA: aminotransferase class V-fold PLP-dependent enzyme [Egibacteraceae bacterium]|nr:aminotransferase class V-fold PLP-dependent enzyme [Egibacteraceae bacterium]
MAERVYLDHASAAPWHPAALAAFEQSARALPGDPSRRHAAGRAARDLLESARAAIAAELGGAPERLAFTSGGTEAIFLAVCGAMAANRTRSQRVVSCAVEHSTVLAAAEASGAQHEVVGVDPLGRVDLDAVEKALGAGAALLNVQHANHEVGALQPLGEIARLCRRHDVLLHVDACQTVGRLPIRLDQIDADFISASGAKFGGGRGIGALAWSPRARFRPLFSGDEREHRRRSGLENLPGAAAMAEALLQLAPARPGGPAAAEAARCDALRRRLRRQIADSIADVEIHGPEDGSAPHIVALSALYVDGETLVGELDRMGFEVHSGSSCATTSGEPSHVLVAMGALTHGHVRASLGPEVLERHIDEFAAALSEAVSRLRARLGPRLDL